MAFSQKTRSNETDIVDASELYLHRGVTITQQERERNDIKNRLNLYRDNEEELYLCIEDCKALLFTKELAQAKSLLKALQTRQSVNDIPSTLAKTIMEVEPSAHAKRPPVVQTKPNRHRPALEPENPPPLWSFAVLVNEAFVRQEPRGESPIITIKTKGEVIYATEETFNGWVHLDKEAGWMDKGVNLEDEKSLDLLRLGNAPLLAKPEITSLNPGSRNFMALFKPGVPIRVAPCKKADLCGFVPYGTCARVITQLYNGWVRLADDKGFMLSFDPSHGQLLTFLSEDLLEEEDIIEPDLLKESEEALDPDELLTLRLSGRICA